ncbi:UNVERIFIED_CONTAM: Syntaxin-8 [Gekko kuhli]
MELVEGRNKRHCTDGTSADNTVLIEGEQELSVYDSTYLITQEIAEKIQERNRCQRNGESTAKLSVAIRSLLQNLKEKTDHLKDLLFRSVSTRQLTQHEGDRRQNLLDDLLTRHGRLQASFRNDNTEPDVIRFGITTFK